MSLILNGSSQYIQLGTATTIVGTRPFTVAAVMRMGTMRTSGQWHAIACQGDASDRGWYLEVEAAASNRNLFFQYTSAGPTQSNATGTAAIASDSGWWFFAAVVRDVGASTTIDLYTYSYSTPALTITTDTGNADADPIAVGGSDPTVLGAAINTATVIDRWPGEVSWIAAFNADLGNSGQAGGSSAIWELIHRGPWGMIDANTELLASFAGAAQDYSDRKLTVLLSGSPTFAAGGPATETSGIPVILVQRPQTPSAITGTLAGTLPALTGAVSGTVAVSGTLAGVLPALTSDITGSSSVTINGFGFLQTRNTRMAGIGSVPVSGTLTGTLPSLTSAVAGTVAVSGTLAGSLPALTGAIVSAVAVSGSISTPLPALTGAVAGTVAISGTLAGSVPALTAAINATATDSIAGFGFLQTRGTRVAGIGSYQTQNHGFAYVASARASMSGAGAYVLNNVPAPFVPLAAELDTRLDAVEQTLDRTVYGRRSNVAFGAQLSTANSNRGLALLGVNALTGVTYMLDAFQGLGITSVVFPITYPILSPSFDGLSTEDPVVDRSAAFISFFASVVDLAHARGMTVMIETPPAFPSYGTLPIDYTGVTLAQWHAGLKDTVETIITDIQPDYLSIATEPDVTASLLGLPVLATVAGYEAQVDYVLSGLVPGTIKIVAGIGTWNDIAFLEAVADKPAIDALDIHIFPLTGTNFADALEMIELARVSGKEITLAQTWLYKQYDSEVGASVTDQTIFGRDVWSFWQPYDEQMLRILVKIAHGYGFAMLEPYWTRYLFANLTYSDAQAAETPATNFAAVDAAASPNIVSGTFTPVGTYYGDLITGDLDLLNTNTAQAMLTPMPARMTGIGVVPVTGTLAAALPKLTGSVIAGTIRIATLAASLPALTGASSGTVAISGSLSASLPKLLGAATGAVAVSGTLAGALPVLTAAVSAGLHVTGTLTGTLPNLTANLTGSIPITGTLSASLPKMTGLVNAGTQTLATLNAALPKLSGAASGTVTVTGNLPATLPKLSGAFAGTVIIIGAEAGTLPALTGAFAGTVAVAGTMAGSLPHLTFEGEVDTGATKPGRIGISQGSGAGITIRDAAGVGITATNGAGVDIAIVEVEL